MALVPQCTWDEDEKAKRELEVGGGVRHVGRHEIKLTPFREQVRLDSQRAIGIVKQDKVSLGGGVPVL